MAAAVKRKVRRIKEPTLTKKLQDAVKTKKRKPTKSGTKARKNVKAILGTLAATSPAGMLGRGVKAIRTAVTKKKKK